LDPAHRERGQGKIGAVIALLIAAFAFYVGFKLVPVKVKLFNFSDRVEQKLQRASWRSYEQAQQETVKFVRQEAAATGLPTEKFKVSMPAPVTGEMVVIVDWEIPVDLAVTMYKWQYHLEKRAPMLGRGGSAF
jgi:hypothetical protein